MTGFGSGAPSSQAVDPSQGLEMLSLLRGVKETGSQTIRGEPATRYRATLDMERLMESLSEGEQGAKLREAFAGVAIPITVWLDQQDRLIRLKYSFDYSELPGEVAAGLSGTARFQFDLFDWGVPLDVEAPPARETSEYSELIERGATR